MFNRRVLVLAASVGAAVALPFVPAAMSTAVGTAEGGCVAPPSISVPLETTPPSSEPAPGDPEGPIDAVPTTAVENPPVDEVAPTTVVEPPAQGHDRAGAWSSRQVHHHVPCPEGAGLPDEDLVVRLRTKQIPADRSSTTIGTSRRSASS